MSSIFKRIFHPHPDSRAGLRGTGLASVGDSSRPRSPIAPTASPRPARLPKRGISTMSLSDFCAFVDEAPNLLAAAVLSTSCHAHKSTFVLHRFLVVRLVTAEGQGLWLRLDRRPRGGFFGVCKGIGKTPANDTVQLTLESESLLIPRGSRMENQQEFVHPPCLGDLRHFLGVICSELNEYSVWLENCWLFCSLLQQHLAGSCPDTSIRGQLIERDLAPKLRRRVNTFVDTWDPMPAASRIEETLMALKPSPGISRQEILLCVYVAQTTCRRWRWLKDSSSKSAQARLVAMRLAQELQYLANISDVANSSTLKLWEHSAALASRLWENELERVGEFVAEQAHLHCRRLLDRRLPVDACRLGAAAVEILRRLHRVNSVRHEPQLSSQMEFLSVALLKAGKRPEAIAARSEAANLHRQASLDPSHQPQAEDTHDDRVSFTSSYAPTLVHAARGGRNLDLKWLGPKIYLIWSNLARVLQASAVAFVESGRLKEAKGLTDNACIMLRILHHSFPQDFQRDLALCLQNQGVILHMLGCYDMACDLQEESIVLTRSMVHANLADQHRLADRLDNFAISLYRADRLAEAEKAMQESIEVSRRHLELCTKQQYTIMVRQARFEQIMSRIKSDPRGAHQIDPDRKDSKSEVVYNNQTMSTTSHFGGRDKWQKHTSTSIWQLPIFHEESPWHP